MSKMTLSHKIGIHSLQNIIKVCQLMTSPSDFKHIGWLDKKVMVKSSVAGRIANPQPNFKLTMSGISNRMPESWIAEEESSGKKEMKRKKKVGAGRRRREKGNHVSQANPVGSEMQKISWTPKLPCDAMKYISRRTKIERRSEEKGGMTSCG